jgi:predicted DNA-binding transcriptional regulator AlpA
MNNNHKLISFKELSQIIGCSENSVRYHYRMGRFKAAAKLGKRVLFDANEVLAQLKRDLPR